MTRGNAEITKQGIEIKSIIKDWSKLRDWELQALVDREYKENRNMTKRMCSCCGEPYTDESGHDLDKCIETCKYRLHQTEKAHAISAGNLERAYERKSAQLREQLQAAKEVDND